MHHTTPKATGPRRHNMARHRRSRNHTRRLQIPTYILSKSQTPRSKSQTWISARVAWSVWRLGWEDTWTKLLLQGTPDAETAYEVGPSGSRPDKLGLLRTDGRTGASRSSLAAGAQITVSFTLLSYNGNRHVNPKFYKIFYRRCSVPTSS